MVEGHLLLPAGDVVAVCAVGALLPLVRVVGAMTRDAGRGELLILERAGVTAFARQTIVCAEQRELRVGVVIEARGLPDSRTVTLCAGCAIAPVVNVVTAVACKAVACGDRLHAPPCMTALAPGRRVGASQREARVAGMVEGGLLPAGRAVTRFAPRAVAPLVCVVECMAARAVPGRVGVALTGVTDRAFHFLVLSGERKLRLGMVEARFLPAALDVAVRACRSKLAPVRVGLAVARSAVRLRLAEWLSRRVAPGARDTRVGADQREVGEVVVERLPIETHDVCVAPEVFGVTNATISSAGGGRPTMKAALPSQVGRDFVVTHETQSILRATLEWLVALSALRLDVRVRSDDGSRHDEPLQGLRGRGEADTDG